ncbi:MAG: hypothetical protein IKA47_01535 [Oscillospiraceae bacterium]|nr:hypothetical protein [Oscillospiraceae bacterium]
MTPEYLLDAMNDLPEDLLDRTDRIRDRKPICWQPWVAAACLVLAVGVAGNFLRLGGEKSYDSMKEDAGDAMHDDQFSTTGGYWWSATVLTAEKEKLTVRLGFGQEAEVILTQLEEKMEYTPGQRIRIWLKEPELPADGPLEPVKIELEEETR